MIVINEIYFHVCIVQFNNLYEYFKFNTIILILNVTLKHAYDNYTSYEIKICIYYWVVTFDCFIIFYMLNILLIVFIIIILTKYSIKFQIFNHKLMKSQFIMMRNDKTSSKLEH